MAGPELHPIDFAYHVTKISDDSPQPNWKSIECTIANTDFNGVLRGQKCVYFSTTLWRGGLPDKTVYPSNGIGGRWYWRAKVPINKFDGYDIWHCKTLNGQVLLVMARPEDRALMEDLRKKSGGEFTNDTRLIDQHLQRLNTQGKKTYKSNDYYDCKKFVNIAVLHDVPLTWVDGWDTVEKLQLEQQAYYM